MTGSITWIEPVRSVVEPARFGSDHPMRTVTRQIGSGEGWSPERASFVAGVFDTLSVDWHCDHSSDLRLAPLEDALDRGDLPPGRLVEIGCGTGAATERIAARRPVAAALDLSPKMLALADPAVAPFVRADAGALPLASASVDVMVLVNMFMFAASYDRVLAPGGRFVWISTMGDETPIYFPPDEVMDLLPGRWTATGSYAGTGFWLVARRS
ncbi:MAG: class I SAM-dependent methyltransferase [Acidimicrobiaceae bacterium]|nr:class I SAM-dependent methyltransferase [Acidimicrobiaceae bacterium]MYG99690.1 class I SAM-dependent methyltransferase [Acidimicrobiaceae bacterium]MYL04062.1 class I SAM-dependent methyltransferase [Acidimicrobiaceae bacterium]